MVLYNPDSSVVHNIEQYPFDLLKKVILVDNSFCDNGDLFYDALVEHDNLTYIPLERNTGLAAGMNRGIRLIMEECAYIITMDQDSVLTSSIVKVYNSFFKKYPGMVCALTPEYDTDRHRPQRRNGAGRVRFSMQSGTIFPVSIFRRIGLFDERLFIEVVDWEFFLRMEKAGIPMYRCFRAVLRHAPASTREKNLPGFTLKYGTASPVRYYYQARNLLYTGRRYRCPGLYVNLAVKLAKILLLFDHRRDYLRHFFQGIRDAGHHRLGDYPYEK